MSKGFGFFYFLMGIVLCPLLSWGQDPEVKETWTWVISNNIGLKFGPGVAQFNGPFQVGNGELDEPRSSISDKDGNLFFYTNGVHVWDKNNQLMPNGENIGTGQENSTSTGSLIVKKPGNDSIYYVFSIQNIDNTKGQNLAYSVVDMKLQGNAVEDSINPSLPPLGDVTEEKKVTVPTGKGAAEKMTAIVHDNCIDVWIVVKEQNSNGFFSYLLTEKGLETPGVLSQAGFAYNSVDHCKGEMTFSPDGKKLAATIMDQAGTGIAKSIAAQVFDFNNETGKVSNENVIDLPVNKAGANNAYGIAFSPNGKLVYISSISQGNLIQFDLENPTTPHYFAPKAIGGQLKLGPDGKIYFNYRGTRNMGVVNAPNEIGNAANFNATGLSFGSVLPYALPDMYVAPPSIMLDSLLKVDIGCSPEGEIEIYVSGGYPPYKYTIDGGVNWQDNGIFKGLVKKKYDIIVEDSKGCYITAEIEIIDKPAELEKIVTVDDSCKYCTGSIVVYANGGTPPFEYSIDGGKTWQKDSLFEDLCEGNYDEILVRDQGGCKMEGKAVIGDIGIQLDATITPIGPLCMFDETIQLEVVDTGGVFSGPGVDEKTGVFDPAASGPGIHKIKYSLPGNCGDEDEIEIIVYGKEEAVIEPAGPFCHLSEKFQLKATPPGGVWSGPGVSADGLFDPAVGVGVHTITYKFEKGECGDTTTGTVEVKPLPVIEITGDPLQGCSPLEVNFNYTSSPPAVSCKWDFGNGTSSLDCDNAKATYIEVGCYDVSLSVETAFGCRSSELMPDMVCVRPDPIAEFTADPRTAKLANPRFSFTNQSIGAVKYYWTFDQFGNSENVHTQFLFPEEERTYTICLRAETEVGCLDSICHDVIVIDEFSIFVPNAFSPNGDGVNDFFYPLMRGYSRDEFKMEIFNRWGEAVFKTTNTEERWDGTYRKKDDIEKQEVYIWKIKAKDKYTGKVHRLMGHFSLLK